MGRDMAPGERALVRRVGGADYQAWRSQVERVRHCSNPVRITGSAAAVDSTTGEVHAEYSTEAQPDGALLVACGDRRASVCPSCAEVYRRDMWHVVASGLAGRMSSTSSRDGAGARQHAVDVVPASVGQHPRLFVTLTAPSFGPVHSARDGQTCRPRASRVTCRHGRPVGCNLVHEAGHRVVGTPICADCYDYVGAVLWHAHLGELWRRTRIAVDRALAPLVSEALGRRVTVAGVRDLVRVSYVKVAEFQKRGLVHLHMVIRLDGVDPDDTAVVVAPPSWASAGLLARAVDQAITRTSFPLPSPDGVMRTAHWGHQRDVTDVSAGGAVTDPRRVAAYLAKYATKTASDTAGSGALARRFHRLHRSWLRAKVGLHLARMVETAWDLGARKDLEHLKLRRWAHTLGYRGHFSTKSRKYSVTMGALRSVRRAWRARQRRASGQTDVWASGGENTVVGDWRYAGRGYATSEDAMLAEMMAREYEIAREEYRDALAREKEVRFWCDPDQQFPSDV